MGLKMNNDQEWRSHLFSELKEIKTEVSAIKVELINLKIKVAGVSSIIGSVMAYFCNKYL